MKKSIVVILIILFLLTTSYRLFPQSITTQPEFGLKTGALLDRPVVRDGYILKTAYLNFYLLSNKNEFNLGIAYPSKTRGDMNGEDIDPRISALAGYRRYLLKLPRRDNIYFQYSFQLLRFKGPYDVFTPMGGLHTYIEINTYLNNVLGFGFIRFFDKKQRFGFYYDCGYVFSYCVPNVYRPRFIWYYLNFNFGFNFKLSSFEKKLEK